jgi:hypothetical protein
MIAKAHLVQKEDQKNSQEIILKSMFTEDKY